MPATRDLRRVACNHVRIRIIDSNVTTGHRIGLRLSSTVLVNHFLGYIIILLRGIDWMALPHLPSNGRNSGIRGKQCVLVAES